MTNQSTVNALPNHRVKPMARGVLVLAVLTMLAVGAVGGQSVVTDGAVFNASDEGPIVEINETLTLDSPVQYTDAHTVDLSPNATFSSNGTTNVTVTTIDGPWTNLTTHNISTPLAVNATDKQNVTVEGETVSHINISDIDDSDRSSTELVYDADTQVNITLTELTASDSIELLAADDSVVTTVSTDEDGTTTAKLPAGEKRLTVAVEPTSEPPDDDDGGGGGGGGGATEAEPEPTDPDIAEVVEQLESTTATTTEVEIDDSDDGGSVTVDPGEATQTVERISFEEGTSGTVEISEYTDPSTEVTQAITESIDDDLADDTTTDSEAGEESDETESDEESDDEESNEPGSEQGDGEATVSVVTVTDISVASDDGSSDDATDNTATVTMSVPRDEINDPADAVIFHETSDGWEQLETTVESTTGGEVQLAADTTFSLFAVAEVDTPGDDPATATNESGNETENTDTSDDAGATDDGIPGFGISIALVALLSVGAIAAQRGR